MENKKTANNVDPVEEKKKKKLTKKQKRKRKRIIFIVEIVVLLAIVIALCILNMYGKIQGDDIDKDDLGINEEIDEKLLKGYMNIALFGLDNSNGQNYENGNSDVIMIASINNETKEVRLVSVYRDTYLNTGDSRYSKANAAYMRGGVGNAVAMLNTNLDLDIEDYICVNWVAMAEIIDRLGGIDIEITAEEAENINLCREEIDAITGKYTPEIHGEGMTHLDGTQATAYARIRNMAGDDFMRASRQRIVLQAMVDKIQVADAGTLVAIANDVLDDVKTSLTIGEITSLAKHVKKYSVAGTTGFPMALTTGSTGSGDSVIPVDLANNVSALHTYLFGETDYVPSSVVQTISAHITEETGIGPDYEGIYDLDRWLELSDPEWEKNHMETESTEGTEASQN